MTYATAGAVVLSLLTLFFPLTSRFLPVPLDRESCIGKDADEKVTARIEIGRFDPAQVLDTGNVLGVGTGVTERPLVERPHWIGVPWLVSPEL